MKHVLKEIASADQAYSLINDGDRILAGISGGKDSAFMLYALLKYKEQCGLSRTKSFTIMPVHLAIAAITPDISELQSFFHELGTDILIQATEIGEILELKKEKDKISCSLCSSLRRGRMTDLALSLGCTKIAYAHHGTDALDTLFLNMMFSSSVKIFQPLVPVGDSGISLIRPLCTLSASEISRLVSSLRIPFAESLCANSRSSARSETRNMLASIFQKDPEREMNMIRAVCRDLYAKGDIL